LRPEQRLVFGPGEFEEGQRAAVPQTEEQVAVDTLRGERARAATAAQDALPLPWGRSARTRH
jgi:hypothetical protein